MRVAYLFLYFTALFVSCSSNSNTQSTNVEEDSIIISRQDYENKLYGFWLGQCIANWTGLVTEMDKIGNIGNLKTGSFYTRDDWGQPDKPSIWGEGVPSDLSENIDFVFRDSSEVWGADDDTDIEYMYQYLLVKHKTTKLTPEQIKNGWLTHIRHEEENYLWVSNQRAFDLMKQGVLPPQTGHPNQNAFFEMIDAQLTTEIFGLFSPARPDIARKIAKLPIQTTARFEAESISKFYVTMHSLASLQTEETLKNRILWMADESRKILDESTYPALMYDYTKQLYLSGIPWEQTRDSIYQRYQINQKDGYDITGQNLYCNGCFASGINFAASLVSLFYGEGNFKETIKIGTLCGWDSDNPTATWGGLIGFIIGKKGIENAFLRQFSNRFNIHRTRQNFKNDGIDTFSNMASNGLLVIDEVVTKEMGGRVNHENDVWIIPTNKTIDFND